ncbi:hypothetical protein TCAL_16985 [Tigriopus californicus]|uniref:Uncharacterized protein n=1 Tax=Tigriopus californicus TaxID=6832 RepID=A0A553PIF3_TIGCA|nr:hypothetical protein TCAL_16985 [Tigriopus californicus]
MAVRYDNLTGCTIANGGSTGGCTFTFGEASSMFAPCSHTAFVLKQKRQHGPGMNIIRGVLGPGHALEIHLITRPISSLFKANTREIALGDGIPECLDHLIGEVAESNSIHITQRDASDLHLSRFAFPHQEHALIRDFSGDIDGGQYLPAPISKSFQQAANQLSRQNGVRSTGCKRVAFQFQFGRPIVISVFGFFSLVKPQDNVPGHVGQLGIEVDQADAVVSVQTEHGQFLRTKHSSTFSVCKPGGQVSSMAFLMASIT